MTGALMSPARLQGGDPVMLASVQDYLDDRLVARPHIKSIEELKGKRIGISRFGAASHMRVLNLLPRFGLGEKDVTFLQIGDTPARVVALLGASIDASSFSPPDHLAAAKAGMRIVFNMRDMNVAYQGTGLVTTQRQIAKSRDVVKRMVKAYVDAIHVVRTNPGVSKRAFVKYRKTNDEKQLDEAYQTLREIVRTKPYPSVEGFKTIFKDVSERIPAGKTANPKEFMDISFLEELDRAGYIDGLYR
jgi:ABC-type nitrate/sulfonate/bicarbonate transport system substrate-binding protein